MNKLLLSIALLVGGCGKGKETPSKRDDNNSTTAKPVKELTQEEKVLGTYELKKYGATLRVVILENGIVEGYKNGKKEEGEGKWSISKEGEIHIVTKAGIIIVYRIDKDGSITQIAYIEKDGKRIDPPEEEQATFKKIK